MHRENPPTASERQRKAIKHAFTHIKHGKRKSQALSQPTPARELSEETPTPQNEEDLETDEANSVHEEAAEALLSSGVGEGVDEGSSSGVAPEEGDGGPIDSSVLKTFKDHIAYYIWHREEVLIVWFLYMI